ncbi:MAG TPA: LPS export ABC transporter periplasmic protein LptC [Firmicutes bacterium]|nr:LPS export ABC transporter periplasmic protein LptC [Bacillota bacterium]
MTGRGALRALPVAGLALSLLVVAGTVGAAAGPAGPAAEPKEVRVSVKENRAFRFAKDVVTIEGTIELAQGDVRLWAGRVVYDTKKKTGELSGDPRLAQEDLTITAAHFSAWFDEEKYTFADGVRLVKKEKESGGGEKLVLTADRVDYNAKDRSLAAAGNVSIRQKERTATARTAEYRDKESRLILAGGVVVKDKEDKTIRGERVLIDLDQDTVEVEGPVEAEFLL